MVQNGQMLTSDWGFNVKNIRLEKALLWYGTKDVNVPVAGGRYLADHVPHAVLREYEGITHITIHEHAIEMLGDLITESTDSS